MKKEITSAVLVLITASGALAALKQASATKMDTDKDGKVSLAEYVASSAEKFVQKDKNKDGVLTPDEHTHKSFKKADQDKNGQLTRAEYNSIYEQQFKRAHDKNGDGFIASDEIQ
jgi:hypothetical protein